MMSTTRFYNKCILTSLSERKLMIAPLSYLDMSLRQFHCNTAAGVARAPGKAIVLYWRGQGRNVYQSKYTQLHNEYSTEACSISGAPYENILNPWIWLIYSLIRQTSNIFKVIVDTSYIQICFTIKGVRTLLCFVRITKYPLYEQVCLKYKWIFKTI